MGLRFHKSIKLPLGFKLNLSKHGIGYSWGVKGARISKTATGKTRKTLSLPGTGLSYVKETSSKEAKSPIAETNSKLKQVFLNEETGEIIDKNPSKKVSLKNKTYDEVIENIASSIEDKLN